VPSANISYRGDGSYYIYELVIEISSLAEAALAAPREPERCSLGGVAPPTVLGAGLADA
jgi:hypothetical protein